MNIIGHHHGTQPIVDCIPPGWNVDKFSSSPLNGFVYIHNGTALSKRMLAPCPPPQQETSND